METQLRGGSAYNIGRSVVTLEAINPCYIFMFARCLEFLEPVNLNNDLLDIAVMVLVRRHAQLRGVVHTNCKHLVHHNKLPRMSKVTCSSVSDALAHASSVINDPYDVFQDLLFRVCLICVEESSSVKKTHFLAVAAHHIVVDGFSMNAIMEDIIQLYNGEM